MSSTRTVRPRRTFIFAPGLKPDMFPKALASGADIVCCSTPGPASSTPLPRLAST